MNLLNLSAVLVLLIGGGASQPVNETDIDTKIVGGGVIPIERAPYQVLIIIRGNMQCGGTLISQDLVMTAAHCLISNPTIRPSEVMVYAGSHNRRTMTQSSAAKWYKTHERYQIRAGGNAFDNDIALVKLAKRFTINNQVRSITMRANMTMPGTPCYISGWGTEFYGTNQVTEYLKGANVQAMPFNVCNATYSRAPLWAPLHPDVICAGVNNDRVDTCQGDSGGPLVCNDFLVGVVSYGYKCAELDYYGVYTEVYKYRQWIMANGGHTLSFSLTFAVFLQVIALASYFN